VYNLLYNVRSTPQGGQEDESYTARVLRDAITPECVQRMRSSTNEELLQQFRELVMRVSLHLGREERRLQREAAAAAAAAAHQKGGKRKQQQQQQQDATPPAQQQQQPPAVGNSAGSGTSTSSEAPALAANLDKVVDDYSVHIMLVSMVSFKSIQRLCLYSLDTLQTCSPPSGYWAEVLAEMQLSPEQMQQLAHAWGIYAEKIAPHFKRTQELAQQVREMLLAADLASSGMSSLTLSSRGGSASALPDNQQQPDASAAAAAAGAAAAPKAALEAQGVDTASPMQTDAVQLQQVQEPVLQAGQQQQQQQRVDKQQQPQGHGPHPQPPHDGLPHHLQPRSSSSSSSSGCGTLNSSGTGSGSSTVKPWQEFGLGYTSGLGAEEADKLQELLGEMTQHFGAMSQLSHAHTFPVWNMLSRLQLARMAVVSYPFMPNVCQSELGLCL
jgi:hypothetical protein